MLRKENERLKRKLALLEKTGAGGMAEMEEIYMKEEKYKNIEKYLREAEEERKNLKGRLDQTYQALEETKSELFKTRSELGHFEQLQSLPDAETLRSQIKDLRSALENEKKQYNSSIESQSKLLSTSRQELDSAIENDKQLKAKIKQLETELDSALKKASYSMYGSRSSSRPNSGFSNKSGSSTNSNNKRSNSVPANQKAKPSVPRPSYNNPMRNNYMRPAQVRNNNFNQRNSPSGSNRSNSESNERNNNNRYINKAYGGNNKKSPSANINRKPSPAANPRNNIGYQANKISPLRAANQKRPTVPPPRVANKKPSPARAPGVAPRNNSKGSVYDRLYGNSGPQLRSYKKEENNPIQKRIDAVS